MRKLFPVGLLLALLLLVPALAAQSGGPAKGHLVAVGGAMRDPAIIKKFIELAGGPDTPIVVIPTAGAEDTYDQDWRGLRGFREAGATNLTVLHTRDRTVAGSEEFVAPLRTARGVFFPGGRQTRLAEAYLDTRTHRELAALLERGGVIGGTSAGASILASFLVRGDTRTNTIMVGEYARGFGFLPDSAIDQHVLKRNRQFDLAPIIAAHPELLGIGLDENTAIVISGDEFEVIGQSYVTIHDARRHIPPEGAFYFLAPGDRFNLKTREASRRQGGDYRALERVAPRPAPAASPAPCRPR